MDHWDLRGIPFNEGAERASRPAPRDCWPNLSTFHSFQNNFIQNLSTVREFRIVVISGSGGMERAQGNLMGA